MLFMAAIRCALNPSLGLRLLSMQSPEFSDASARSDWIELGRGVGRVCCLLHGVLLFAELTAYGVNPRGCASSPTL